MIVIANHNKPTEECVEPRITALDVELEENEILLLKTRATK